MNLFESLSKFGFTNLNDIDVFKEEEKKKNINLGAEKKEIKESDFIYERKYKCTCCGKQILSKTIKTGRIHISKTDLDLRNRYEGIDPYKYGIVFCPECGYASLASTFSSLTDRQMKKIRENISVKFQCNQNLLNKTVYDYQDAITLHELALLNVIVKEGKNSEKAYICLKLGWIFRGAIEKLDEEKDKKLIEKYKDKEKQFLSSAHKGFMMAREKEGYPIAGMNENTLDYLLAAIGYEIGEKDSCLKLLGGVITNRNATRTIKNKALDLKDIITKENHKSKTD